MERVVHVLHRFPPETRGGTEGYVERLARAQHDAGREVAIVCATQGPPVDELSEGLRVVRLRALTPLEVWRDDFGATRRDELAAALDVLRPDLVHVHHWDGHGPGAVAAARRVDRPAVVTLHDLHTVCPLHFRLRDGEPCATDVPVATCAACVGAAYGLAPEGLAEGLAARYGLFRAELEGAAAVLAVSRALAEYLRAVPALDGLAVEALPLPSPTDLAPAVAHARDDESLLRVVTWGGLDAGKGLDLLVEAAATLPAGTVTVDHFGRELDPAFAARVDAAAPPGVLTRHGRYEPDAAPRLFPAFDLAAFPSRYLETHGLVVDEALRLGLPVVVPDRGAPRERIGGRGRLFRAGSAADLARVLRELQGDPAELARLRAGAPGPLATTAEHLAALDAVYARVSASADRGRA